MTAFSQLDEKVFLIYLNLNHKDRMNFYEPLEDFIDEHRRLYIHVAAGNRALLAWAKMNGSGMESSLLKRCAPEDQIAVRELCGEDQLPESTDQVSLSAWLLRQEDWAQWHKEFPDSPAIPTRGVDWVEEPPVRRHQLTPVEPA